METDSCKSKCANLSPHCSQGATSIGTRATCVTVHASAPGTNVKGCPSCPKFSLSASFSIFQHFVDLFVNLVVDLTSISPWIPEEDKRKSRQTSPPPSPITAPARVYSASSHRWSQNHRHERTHLGVRLFVPLNLSGKSCEPQPHS